MAKIKFDILESTCVPLPLENVDTDQIIPARFLSATSREGFGSNLFRDWRYTKNGELNNTFVLNDPLYKGDILVAGKKLWLRFEPRACCMGNIRLWIQGSGLKFFR